MKIPRRILWVFSFSAVCCTAVTGQVIVNTPFQQSTARVIMLAPREYQQLLRDAEEDIEAQQYSSAIEKLRALATGKISDETALREDFFVGAAGQDAYHESIRTKAVDLIGSLPKQARQLYELQYGAEATQQLQAALANNNFQQLAEVSRQYFHTDAGYRATLLLGYHHFNTARPMEAAMCFDRLRRSTAASASFDPAVSILSAISWQQAGMSETASRVIRVVAETHAGETVAFGDRTLVVPPADSLDSAEAAQTWLAASVGQLNLARRSVASNWELHRGNAARNAESVGDMPLMHLRWEVSVGSPADEAILERQVQAFRESSEAAIPAVSPLVVGRTVLFKTTDRLIAVDFKTGKRVWPYPWSEPIETDTTNADASRAELLRSRFWDDSVFGQLSSNGADIYLIDDLTDVERSVTFNRLGMQAAGDNRSNSLVALNVPSEGKIRWKVGGETGDLEPQLARVFFLGPPLALGNELYVLGERNSDISLFALDQETGALRWSQQIAFVDQMEIGINRTRRLAGASPSYADGVLVCPTSAGAIVALDLANRSLLWARQFDQAVPDVFSRRGVIIRRNRSNSLETGWLDATVAISNGVVIATPVESNELHAFDLVTGEPAWPKPVSRNTGLYVGAVTDEIVLIVGEDGVQGISLQNGNASWDIRYRDIEDGSGMELRPTGRGFASQGHYFLPTTSQLLRIDISTGQIVDSLETRQPLGNLVCYQNNLISFSPAGVSAFFQVESLKLLVQSRLAQDANDPWALQHQGMLLLEEGQVAAGLESLRLAVRNYPEDHPRRTMAKAILVDGLLAAMKEDYNANAALASEVVDLVEQPEQQRKFLRIVAQSKLASGDISEAFDAYLRLGFDVSSGDNSLVESKNFSATLNCVVRNGIEQCLTQASAALRTELDSRIEQTVNKAVEANDQAMQQRCVEVFHSHRSVAPLTLKMAESAFAEQKLLASEIYAAPLTRSDNPSVAARAMWLLTKIRHQNGDLTAAQNGYQALLERWSDQTLEDGKTVTDLAAAIGLPQTTVAVWPSGEVKVTVNEGSPVRRASQRYNFAERVEQQGVLAPTLALRTGLQDLLFSNDLGHERFRVNTETRLSSAGSVRWSQLGSLAIVNLGTTVIGIDLASSNQGLLDSAVAWPRQYEDALEKLNVFRSTRSTRTRQNRWAQSDQQVRGQRISSVGPTSYQRIVYQEGSQLRAISPLDGQTLWVRTDIAPYSEVWGDDQVIIVADDKKTCRIYSAIDGSEIQEASVPDAERRWTTLGRYVLTWDDVDSNGTQVWQLRMYDPISQQIQWETPCEMGTRGFVLDGLVALVTNAGDFRLVRLDDGQVLATHHLDLLGRKLNRIQLIRSAGSKLLLACCVEMLGERDELNALDSEKMEDALYFSVDVDSGELTWPSPAYIEAYGVPEDQPESLPTMVFRRRRKDDNRRWKTSAVWIDKRDGRLIHQYEDHDNRSNPSFQVVGVPETSTITYPMPDGRTYELQFTDDPRAPQGPAFVGSGDQGRNKSLFMGIGRAVLESFFRGAQSESEDAPDDEDFDFDIEQQP